MSRSLTVYTRAGCSLCEAVLEELAPLARELGLAVRTVDVDRDPALAAVFGERVPVLAGPGGREICHFFLDEHALRAHFAPT